MACTIRPMPDAFISSKDELMTKQKTESSYTDEMIQVGIITAFNSQMEDVRLDLLLNRNRIRSHA